jgi:hypothetical protein
LIEDEVDVPDHPVPVIFHMKLVAPAETALMVATTPEPQGSKGTVIAGVGSVDGVGATVNTNAVLLPQPFTALAESVATPVPTVKFIVLLVLVPLQPVPATVHV